MIQYLSLYARLCCGQDFKFDSIYPGDGRLLLPAISLRGAPALMALGTNKIVLPYQGPSSTARFYAGNSLLRENARGTCSGRPHIYQLTLGAIWPLLMVSGNHQAHDDN